jgi:hypothetical protein
MQFPQHDLELVERQVVLAEFDPVERGMREANLAGELGMGKRAPRFLRRKAANCSIAAAAKEGVRGKETHLNPRCPFAPRSRSRARASWTAPALWRFFTARNRNPNGDTHLLHWVALSALQSPRLLAACEGVPRRWARALLSPPKRGEDQRSGGWSVCSLSTGLSVFRSGPKLEIEACLTMTAP